MTRSSPQAVHPDSPSIPCQVPWLALGWRDLAVLIFLLDAKGLLQHQLFFLEWRPDAPQIQDFLDAFALLRNSYDYYQTWIVVGAFGSPTLLTRKFLQLVKLDHLIVRHVDWEWGHWRGLSPSIDKPTRGRCSLPAGKITAGHLSLLSVSQVMLFLFPFLLFLTWLKLLLCLIYFILFLNIFQLVFSSKLITHIFSAI